MCPKPFGPPEHPKRKLERRNMAKILVTGATGTIGNQLVRELCRRGADVRAAGHTAEKLEELQGLEVELQTVDLNRRELVDEAVRGVDRVFLLTPFIADFERQVRNVVEASKAAGVEHIVRLSALGSSPAADVGVSQQHGRCDEMVAASGISWTILRPTFLQDNLLGVAAGPIREQSAFYGASGNGEVAYVSSADIAASAAEILLDPAPHAGKTYVLTGPEALSDGAVAEVVSHSLGRKVSYVDLSPQELSAGMRQSGVPDWLVEAIVGMERMKSSGQARQVSAAVEELTGHPGERYEQFVERHREALA